MLLFLYVQIFIFQNKSAIADTSSQLPCIYHGRFPQKHDADNYVHIFGFGPTSCLVLHSTTSSALKQNIIYKSTFHFTLHHTVLQTYISTEKQ